MLILKLSQWSQVDTSLRGMKLFLNFSVSVDLHTLYCVNETICSELYQPKYSNNEIEEKYHFETLEF